MANNGQRSFEAPQATDLFSLYRKTGQGISVRGCLRTIGRNNLEYLIVLIRNLECTVLVRIIDDFNQSISVGRVETNLNGGRISINVREL